MFSTRKILKIVFQKPSFHMHCVFIKIILNNHLYKVIKNKWFLLGPYLFIRIQIRKLEVIVFPSVTLHQICYDIFMFMPRPDDRCFVSCWLRTGPRWWLPSSWCPRGWGPCSIRWRGCRTTSKLSPFSS